MTGGENVKVQKYKHDSEVSYTLGATLTYELLIHCPSFVTRVFVGSSTDLLGGISKIIEMCNRYQIPVEKNDKAFNILSPKGNCYVIGEFKKVSQKLKKGNHIVLVNPSDAGNLGTILRTATGFGITNLAIIKPAVDFFDPKTIRASMGAAFHVAMEYFDSIEEYLSRYPSNKRYAFMLTASTPLTEVKKDEPYSLIFGNEATGLPDSYAGFCTSVRINHSTAIDSLNLPMAAGIAMYQFTQEDWKQK